MDVVSRAHGLFSLVQTVGRTNWKFSIRIVIDETQETSTLLLMLPFNMARAEGAACQRNLEARVSRCVTEARCVKPIIEFDKADASLSIRQIWSLTSAEHQS